MKNRLYAFIFAVFLLAGCGRENYNPPIIKKIGPEISYIAVQAKKTTNSAEQTVAYADVVKNKYDGDKDAVNTLESAKQTVIESQKTEVQLKTVQAKADKLDSQAKELEENFDKATDTIGKQKKENETLTEKIKAMAKTIWGQRFIIIGLGVALVTAIAFVVKPWKWFI